MLLAGDDENEEEEEEGHRYDVYKMRPPEWKSCRARPSYGLLCLQKRKMRWSPKAQVADATFRDNGVFPNKKWRFNQQKDGSTIKNEYLPPKIGIEPIKMASLPVKMVTCQTRKPTNVPQLQ